MKPLLFLILMFLFALSIAEVSDIDSEGYSKLKYALGVGR